MKRIYILRTIFLNSRNHLTFSIKRSYYGTIKESIWAVATNLDWVRLPVQWLSKTTLLQGWYKINNVRLKLVSRCMKGIFNFFGCSCLYTIKGCSLFVCLYVVFKFKFYVVCKCTYTIPIYHFSLSICIIYLYLIFIVIYLASQLINLDLFLKVKSSYLFYL